MTVLRPLIESSDSEHGRKLLGAARADRPSRGSAGRALAALGVTGAATATAGVASATSAAAGVASSSAASLPLIAAKWLVVGALGGGLFASGASLVFSHSNVEKPEPRAVAPAASVATPVPQTAAHLPPGTTPVTTVTPFANKPLRVTPPASSSSSEPASEPFAAPSQGAFAGAEQSKLLRDVALLDAARRAWRRNDRAEASRLLARYDAERETHVLDHEAGLLRALLSERK